MATKSVELSTKQQIHTLSAKSKKKTKKSFRYALAQTFPRYWPQLNEQQSQQLLDLLKAAQVTNSQWFAGKKVSESCRPIHYGLQASIRKLKSGQIKLLVLSADLKPRYVANQIILQAFAANEDIRILCVPSLATGIRPILNFSCYAFVIDNWSQLAELNKWTAQLISEYFPVPATIKSYFDQRRESKNCQMEVDEPEIKAQQTLEECIEVNRFYLTKEKCEPNQRAFVPKNAINLKPIELELEPLNKIKSDFITLATHNGNNDQPTFSKHVKKSKKRPLTLYRDLMIHKVQSKPNKVKKFKDKKNKKK
ncbi:uncharacterized protein LOC129575015 [Sitodiplosis mosellana]|uniref:uncharacterized protein LOC129575015 n=1 Tax=Sitodiplosis mosellana TaxID=263140 RepID=UPI002444D11D|nr:uncharacterized protein LOC129575015 [Sitodiplosis mosellana]